MRSVSREDFIDADPYRDREQEAKDRQSRSEFIADRERDERNLERMEE